MQEERLRGARTEENRGKTHKEKEKKKSKVEVLENCDRGSFPLPFLLLALWPVQRSVSFFLKDRV